MRWAQQLVGLNAMQEAFPGEAERRLPMRASKTRPNIARWRPLSSASRKPKEWLTMMSPMKGLPCFIPDEAAKIDAATASTKDWMDTQTELNKQMETAAGLLADYNLQMQALQTLQAGYQTG